MAYGFGEGMFLFVNRLWFGCRFRKAKTAGELPAGDVGEAERCSGGNTHAEIDQRKSRRTLPGMCAPLHVTRPTMCSNDNNIPLTSSN